MRQVPTAVEPAAVLGQVLVALLIQGQGMERQVRGGQDPPAGERGVQVPQQRGRDHLLLLGVDWHGLARLRAKLIEHDASLAHRVLDQAANVQQRPHALGPISRTLDVDPQVVDPRRRVGPCRTRPGLTQLAVGTSAARSRTPAARRWAWSPARPARGRRRRRRGPSWPPRSGRSRRCSAASTVSSRGRFMVTAARLGVHVMDEFPAVGAGEAMDHVARPARAGRTARRPGRPPSCRGTRRRGRCRRNRRCR